MVLRKIGHKLLNTLCSKRFWVELAGFILVCICVFLYMLNLASLHAKDLFDKYMEKQNVLKGKITADNVKAHFNGHVIIDNLNWKDDNDELILRVPRAELWVDPFAFVFKRVNQNSLFNIDLYDATIVLGFNDKMQLDVLRQKPPTPKELGEINIPKKRKKNFEWLNKDYPDTRLRLHNFELIAVHKRRHYIMRDVYLTSYIENDRYLHLDLHSHEFGGVLKGGQCNLNGYVDLDPAKRELNMNLSLFQVMPSSLGVQNLNDYTDIGASVSGKLEHPYIHGAISFKELNVGDLRFDKVYGNFAYDMGYISLDDVAGEFCSGSVNASGLYNIDTRDYYIDAVGKGINVGRALKFKDILAEADVDYHMVVDAPRKQGEKQRSHIWGTVKTGPVGYKFYRVKSVKADANIYDSDMLFKDIVVSTDLGDLEMDKLQLNKGRMEIGELQYNDGNIRKELPIRKILKNIKKEKELK